MTARRRAREGSRQRQDDAGVDAHLLAHFAQRGLARRLVAVGPPFGVTPDITAEVTGNLAQQQPTLGIDDHATEGARLADRGFLGPGQIVPGRGPGFGQILAHAVQRPPDVAVAAGTRLAGDQRHLVLEVAVVDVGDDARHRLGEFSAAAMHAPGVVGAAVRLGRRGLGKVVMPQTQQVAARAAADGEQGVVGFENDAEEAEGREEPHEKFRGNRAFSRAAGSSGEPALSAHNFAVVASAGRLRGLHAGCARMSLRRNLNLRFQRRIRLSLWISSGSSVKPRMDSISLEGRRMIRRVSALE